MTSLDSFKSRKKLTVGTKTYHYYSLKAAEKNGLKGVSDLPYSMKVLLENLLRNEDGRSVTKDDIQGVAEWLVNRGKTEREISFRPARVLMQDFTGVPAVVDLAAMRDAMTALKGDPQKINPLVPVDLVIDHSVIVDEFGSPKAFKKNVDLEYQRNGERYRFLKWGQGSFDNFRVVPPGTGICHQVNLEYLAQTVWTRKEKYKAPRAAKAEMVEVAYPDTLVGTDSHTTMVNGLAVLGWGVGGIEAEAAMLGQPQSMLLPEVIGFKLHGKLREGVTATDLVLTVTQMLRKKGVVGKFVEFYGDGLEHLTLADRATIANMAPEYGATCGFFPIDEEAVRFLKATGRAKARVDLVEAYAKAQGMWRTEKSEDPEFTDTLELDLTNVEPSLAGPTRPQDRVPLATAAQGFAESLEKTLAAFDFSPYGFAYPYPYRSSLLAADLRYLGVPAEALHNRRLPPRPSLDDMPAALGCIYVLEGSAKGARSILPAVQDRLGLDASRGASFFKGFGVETRRIWQASIAAVNAIEPHSREAESAIEAALAEPPQWADSVSLGKARRVQDLRPK